MANPLRGVGADARTWPSILDGLPGDLVLVGHSYGGMLIANAATGNDRVKALVFVGAFAPDAGESAAELAGRYRGQHARQRRSAPSRCRTAARTCTSPRTAITLSSPPMSRAAMRS